jgi:hypothetical protein
VEEVTVHMMKIIRQKITPHLLNIVDNLHHQFSGSNVVHSAHDHVINDLTSTQTIQTNGNNNKTQDVSIYNILQLYLYYICNIYYFIMLFALLI